MAHAHMRRWRRHHTTAQTEQFCVMKQIKGNPSKLWSKGGSAAEQDLPLKWWSITVEGVYTSPRGPRLCTNVKSGREMSVGIQSIRLRDLPPR